MALILYVEDHPPARMLMQAILDEMTVHTLMTAESGADAHQKIQTSPPALYIIDLDLPDTDGLTLASELTALQPAPVIIVSAYAEAAQDLSDYHYLAKPLDPDHVAQVIHRTLA